MYNVYTPLPKNLQSEYSSLSHANVFGQPPQPFSPGVGSESAGWVRASVSEVSLTRWPCLRSRRQ